MDWKSLVGTVAPTLATALGGPLAGLAVKAIAGGLGLGEEADEKDVARALAGADPETLAKLKAIDADFAVRMRELDIDLEEIAARDRASAREREAKVGGLIVPTLALAIVGAFVAMAAGMLFGEMTAETALAGAVIGYLSAKAEQVLAYYFGSSAGSKQKTTAMEAMLNRSKAG